MSDTFTASNGIELRFNNGGWIERRNCSDLGTGAWGEITGLNTKQPALVWDALREFFLHERDKELGRWRWPENPSYVVYPDGTSRTVVKESDGHSMIVSLHDRKVMTTYLDSYVGAAKDYDAAHQEPKPWHDAKPDQVWSAVVDSTGGVRPLTVMEYQVEGRVFLDAFHEDMYELTDPCITDAQQIWPEVSP